MHQKDYRFVRELRSLPGSWYQTFKSQIFASLEIPKAHQAATHLGAFGLLFGALFLRLEATFLVFLPMCRLALLGAVDNRIAASTFHKRAWLLFCFPTLLADDHLFARLLVLFPVFCLALLGAVVSNLASGAMLELKGFLFHFVTPLPILAAMVLVGIADVNEGLHGQHTASLTFATKAMSNCQFINNARAVMVTPMPMSVVRKLTLRITDHFSTAPASPI